jgi:hypothetical protein
MNAVPRQLGAIMDVLGLEWTSLFGEGTSDAGNNRDRVTAWLYRILDTLDNKTAQLLRFTALLLAAQTFLVGFLVGKNQIPHWISILALLLLLFPLTTGIVGLSVFVVRWPFLGHVRKEGSEEKGNEEKFKKEFEMLARICDRRTKANQLTFYGCCASSIGFAVTLVLAIIVVIRH